jgi:hypothetical protein
MITKAGVLYSHYTDVPETIIMQAQMNSASKLRFANEGDEKADEPNVIGNEDSDDYDYAAALDTSMKQPEATQQQYKRRKMNMDSSIATEQKNAGVSRGNSNRKHAMEAPLRTKPFSKEVDYVRFNNNLTDEEIYMGGGGGRREERFQFQQQQQPSTHMNSNTMGGGYADFLREKRNLMGRYNFGAGAHDDKDDSPLRGGGGDNREYEEF